MYIQEAWVSFKEEYRADVWETTIRQLKYPRIRFQTTLYVPLETFPPQLPSRRIKNLGTQWNPYFVGYNIGSIIFETSPTWRQVGQALNLYQRGASMCPGLQRIGVGSHGFHQCVCGSPGRGIGLIGRLSGSNYSWISIPFWNDQSSAWVHFSYTCSNCLQKESGSGSNSEFHWVPLHIASLRVHYVHLRVHQFCHPHVSKGFPVDLTSPAQM